MDDEDTLTAWLTIGRAPAIAAAAARRLVNCTDSPTSWLQRPPPDLPAATRSWLRAADPRRLAADRDWLARPGHHLLTPDQPGYPRLLRESDHPPPVLYLVGAAALPTAPQLAVVGSRNPSPAGRELAREFAAGLSRCGLTVTSGLALGIDGAAHAGALAVAGTTLAVLGSGPDVIYPRRHRDLAARLLDAGGALLTELPPGAPPRPWQFPRRNRIIAGLATGVLVVEATLRSGSLITARLAAEQGREVFAVPGPIRHPASRGCHALIRNGAKLTESVADVIGELAPLLALETDAAAVVAKQLPEPGSGGCALLDAMGHESVTIDTLATRTGLLAAEITAGLLVLELDGHVESTPDGQWARVR